VRAIILTPVRFAKSAKHSASIGPSFRDQRAVSEVACGPLSTIVGTMNDVGFWHKADIVAVVIDVCFRGTKRTSTFALGVICGLRIPLRFAHARDGDPLEYASFCERVASRKRFGLRTRLQVDDE
jgi:hypothetical protein